METWNKIMEAVGTVLANRLVQAALTALIVFFAAKLVKAFLSYRLKKSEKLSNRKETILRILSSATTITIYFLGVLEILRILFNVSPATVIAATGVVGVAISFGAQNLVKDVISGFFILFENQYAVGELVTLGDFTGTVESLGLRSTQLRNMEGDIFIIPNGSITSVINHSRGVRGVVLDIDISYDSDVNTAIDVLKKAVLTAKNEMPQLEEEPQVLGVTNLGESSVKVRLLAKCAAGDQFEVERELLRRMKYALDENGISIPYNHLVIVNKEEKETE